MDRLYFGTPSLIFHSVRQTAVCHHVVPLACSVISKVEEIEYVFPPNSIGGAIRIQLEGFQTLHIFRLQVPLSFLLTLTPLRQAFQGDQIIIEPPPLVQRQTSPDGFDNLPYPDFVTDGDAQIRYDTFAAYPPRTFKTKSLSGTDLCPTLSSFLS